MDEEMDKKHCAGCRDDFYNGKNPYGIEECWCFKSAKLELRKLVHKDQQPEPEWRDVPFERLPDCYCRRDHVELR